MLFLSKVEIQNSYNNMKKSWRLPTNACWVYVNRPNYLLHENNLEVESQPGTIQEICSLFFFFPRFWLRSCFQFVFKIFRTPPKPAKPHNTLVH